MKAHEAADMEEYERNEREEKEAKDLAEHITRYVNTFSDNLPKFIEAMGHEHRTLQQNFTRLCFEWLKHLASLPENWYDLRNEASVKMARKIVEKFGDEMYLPTI